MKVKIQFTDIESGIDQIGGIKELLDFELSGLYEVDNRDLNWQLSGIFTDSLLIYVSIYNEWQEVITNCDNLSEGVKKQSDYPIHLLCRLKQNRKYERITPVHK